MARLIQALFIPSIGACLWLMTAQHLGAQQPFGLPDDPIRIDDLGLQTRLPSALDLIGPDLGPAGRSRALLTQALQCWIDGRTDCAGADLNDPRVRAIRQFLTHGPMDRDAGISVEFPDATRIQVRLIRVSDLGPNDWSRSVYTLAVLPQTAQAPGLAAVPSRPADFTGFSYDGPPAIQEALQRLRQRLLSVAAESSH